MDRLAQELSMMIPAKSNAGAKEPAFKPINGSRPLGKGSAIATIPTIRPERLPARHDPPFEVHFPDRAGTKATEQANTHDSVHTHLIAILKPGALGYSSGNSDRKPVALLSELCFARRVHRYLQRITSCWPACPRPAMPLRFPLLPAAFHFSLSSMSVTTSASCSSSAAQAGSAILGGAADVGTLA